MEELFLSEWVQLLLVVVGCVVLFFVAVLVLGLLVNTTPEPASYNRETLNLANDPWTIQPGQYQVPTRPSRSAALPLQHDMLTGERLERAVVLRLIGASGYVLKLTVNQVTARMVQERGLNSVAWSFRRHVDRLRLNGSFIALAGPQGTLQIDPYDWYNELMCGVPSLPPSLTVDGALPPVRPSAQVQQLPSSTRPSWWDTKYTALIPPPPDETMALPPVAHDDDDDEVTNPSIVADDQPQDYLEIQIVPSTLSDQEQFDQAVKELLTVMLEFSNGVDERSILLRDGIPVGYPNIGYEEFEMVPYFD